MKVAIDTRPFENQSAQRGIGMYTSHLIRYLRRRPDVEVVELKSGRVEKDVDVVHYPWFDFYFHTLPLRKERPTVVTIHDVTPLVLTDWYPPGIKGRLRFEMQKLALKSVKMVVTDSVVTTKDVVKYLGMKKEKVKTVHLAPQDGLEGEVSEEMKGKVRRKFSLPDEFVLYVGDVNRNKNLLSLVEACKHAEISLIIVGKQAVEEKISDKEKGHVELRDLERLLGEYGNDPQVRRLGFVDTGDLAVVFGLASLYCQPSLYEGFGVPVLEAMKCGCPVLASKRGSLPEIGGAAAIYTEPTMEKLVKGIQLILGLSKTQRKRLIQEGQKQARRFSWEKTAEKMAQVYSAVMGRNY